jgi:hypothetical protein
MHHNHTSGFVHPSIPPHMLPYYSGNVFPPQMLPFPGLNTVLSPNGIATNQGSSTTQTNKRKRTTSTRAANKRTRQTGPTAIVASSTPALSEASPHCGVGPSTEIHLQASQELENIDPNTGMLLDSQKSLYEC